MTDELDESELATVIAGQEAQLDELHADADDLLDDDEMVELRARAAALLRSRGVVDIAPEPADPDPEPLVVLRSWQELVEGHAGRLEAAGQSPVGLTLDDLLTPAERAEIDQAWIDQLADIDATLDAEAKRLFHSSIRRRVLDAIARPFGIGAVVARLDQRGGNVLLWQQMDRERELDYADPDRMDLPNPERRDRTMSQLNAPYNRNAYNNYSEQRRTAVESDAPLTDEYTGRELPRDRGMNMDHVVSAATIDNDTRANFYLDQDGLADLASKDFNLAPTSESINKSKGADSPTEWADKKRADGTTNLEHYGADEERVVAREKTARDGLSSELDGHEARYLRPLLIESAAEEGLKMGLQQAIGMVLLELMDALLDAGAALFDAWEGKLDGPFFAQLADELKRIGLQVLSGWKDYLKAFAGGALSGILSSLLTTFVNVFVTTSRRLVRLIREGVYSLLRALKMLLLPPAGMTAAQAAHEATKIVTAGVGIGVGVMLEQGLENALLSVPLLAPVAAPLSAVLVGLGVGLSTAVAIVWIDRVDVFGAKRAERQGRTLDLLGARLEEGLAELEAQLA